MKTKPKKPTRTREDRKLAARSRFWVQVFVKQTRARLTPPAPTRNQRKDVEFAGREMERMRDALEFIRDNAMTATKELIVHMANHALANAQAEP
jgi:ribosome recycling factor